LEEALDLSFDRLLMMMIMIGSTCFVHCYVHHQERGNRRVPLCDYHTQRLTTIKIKRNKLSATAKRQKLHTEHTQLTYLLTPWSRVILEKLTGLQLVKKFPAFYGTRRFVTALTSVRHLSLSWASPIQSPYPHPTSWRSILILSTHLCLGLPSGLFPSGFPTKTLYASLIILH